ncbi:hypothetical protein J3E74DRAFT_443701 [Bipolaris maydis]|nr:hypothetical protein J3E74DRAFT_443701 [Bipolaris maydis]
MACGDFLDAPITLEDDDNDENYRYLHAPVPVPPVRRFNTQTLEQGDIEEVEHRTAWEQAVAQRARVKQSVNQLLRGHQQVEQRSIAEPSLKRPPSVKPITIIDLLTDEDAPVRPRVTQQLTGAEILNQSILDVCLSSPQRPEQYKDTVVPQLSTSRPPLEITQPSSFLSQTSPVRSVPAIPIDKAHYPYPLHKPVATNDTVPSFSQPIGDLADHQRERATCRRVNTSERATAAAHANKLESPFPMAAKARMSDFSGSVTLVQPKQKAIKSVRQKNYVQIRAPQHSTSSHKPTNNHKSTDYHHKLPYALQDEVLFQRETANAEPRAVSPAPFQGPLSQNSTVSNLEVSLTERPKGHDATLDPLPLDPQERADTANTTPVEVSFRKGTPPVKDVTPNVNSVWSSHVHDLAATRSAIDECLKRHIAERNEAHAKLTWIKLRHQRTCQERDLRARRKQKFATQPTLPEEFIQHTSPFADIPVVQMPFDRSWASKGLPDMAQEVFVKAKPRDTVFRSGLSAHTTKFRSEAVVIPPFKEYVSLRNNILADNESKLLATPYFEDEDYESRLALLDALPTIYELTHDEKGPIDLRKEQCRFYRIAIEAFLGEIGVTWNEVLYWLLASDDVIKQINTGMSGSEDFSSILLERSQYSIEEFERDEELKETTLFDRDDEKWQDFIKQLERPSAMTLRLAAIACSAVLHECEFSIWYLAQQSDIVQNNILRKTLTGKNPVQSSYRQIWCRVCHQHNCLLHGELRQVPEDSWMTESDEDDDEFQSSRRNSGSTLDEDSSPLPAHFDDDSDIEKVINYKLPANADAFNAYPESEMIASRGAKPPPGKFNAHWWLQRDLVQHWEKRKPFFPCNHEGSCEDARCRCYREGITCEKTCKCSQSCNRRFPGCGCLVIPGKRVCDSDKCLCVKFNRECDAELCGSCGATEILDPVNRYNEDVVARNCFNVAIQRGVPRKTLLGHSEVHGFGLYMGEDIEKGEYIGEYTGEAISVNEGNRRLTIYDYQKTMYLFRLNSKQEVDATYMGNKLRFINNADDKYTNCAPRNLLCNTVFRIALFATTNIKAGTELYFNYNYPKEKTAQFKQPNGKVVAVKETKPKVKRVDAGSKTSQPVVERDRSRILAATAKARAAKAAKRAAMLEEEARLALAKSLPGPFRARKTATGTPSVKRASKLRDSLCRNESTGSDTGLDVEVSDGEMSVAGASQETTTSQYVEDTDEDGEFTTGDSQENGYENVRRSARHGSAVGHRRPGRPRKRGSDVAPAMATERRSGNLGGARPGAGRKRKRPVILNSDDE